MKKDVILFVIDSLGAEEMCDEKYGESCIPFLKRLMGEYSYVENYYSQGSHTESAVPGLICGINTLDYNGYLHRFDDKPKTIFDYYDEKGYETYNISWGRNTLPARLKGKVKNYYLAAFSFNDYLSYTIPYYVKLLKNNSLNEKDKLDLIECYDAAFQGCLLFWDKSSNPQDAYDLLGDIFVEDFKDVYNIIRTEYELYALNKWLYIEKNLLDGKISDVMSNLHVEPNRVLNTNKLKAIRKVHRTFINQAIHYQKKNTVFDRRNDYPVLLKQGIQRLCMKSNLYLSNFFGRLYSADYFKFDQIDKLRDDGASLQTQLDFLKKLIQNHDDEKPKFIYMHVNTIHPPVEWVSFDRGADQIRNDINNAKHILKETKGYHGDFIYRVGMGYVDNCMKRFYEELIADGILGSTILCLTADHGSVIGSRPVRKNRAANNCHTETYHVPMIIIDKDKKIGKIDGFYENIDYLPSIMDWCGLGIPAELKGKSILQTENKSNIVHMERIDTGCPNLEHRNVIYVARNKYYIVEYEVGVFQEFEQGHINEVYDLVSDPDELINIANKIEEERIEDLISFLKKRHVELRLNYKDYCEKKIPSYIFDKENWKEIKWDPRE